MRKSAARVAALMEIEGVTEADACAIRDLWKEASRDKILTLSEAARNYEKVCFRPALLQDLRRIAIDEVLGTYGVEYLGEHVRTRYAVHYCNTGDTYAATVIFVGPHLRIGSWGDMVERGLVKGRAPDA